MLNNTQTYSDMWQNCLDRIKAQTSEEEFVKWFQPIVPLEFDGTNLRLRVPNESYVHQIEKNYIPFLRPIISQLYGQQTRLHYAVPRSTPPAVPVTADADTTAISRFNTQTNTANIKNPFVIPGLKKIIIDPQLNPGLTFATFIEGECNRLARSAGMSVAVNPGNNPFNPLYIYGDSGLGKTHIVQAIGHEVRQRHPELQVLYVSMNKFQAQFQTAYKNGEIPDFIHFYQMIDVLIIDDIQELTEDGHAECVLQHLQPPTAGGQTADSHLGQAARGAERHRTAPADALQVGIVGTAQHARLRHEAQDHPRKGAEVRGADFGRRGGLPGGQHLGQRA